MTANVIQLRETCHSEAVTDVTAVGIRIQNVRENGLPRQSADWLAMTGRGVKYLLYSPRTPLELHEKIHILEIMGRVCPKLPGHRRPILRKMLFCGGRLCKSTKTPGKASAILCADTCISLLTLLWQTDKIYTS